MTVLMLILTDLAWSWEWEPCNMCSILQPSGECNPYNQKDRNAAVCISPARRKALEFNLSFATTVEENPYLYF